MASFSIGRMAITLSINTAPMMPGANQAGRVLNNIKNQVANIGQGNNVFMVMGNMTNRVGQAAAGASLSMGGLASAAAAAAAAVGLFAGIKMSLGLHAELEKAEVSFGVLLGSVEKGKKLTAELRQFALETPFGPKDTLQSARQMLAFGISAEKLLPTMRVLGDLAMGDKESFVHLAKALSDVKALGRLQGQEVRQFANAGVGIHAALSKSLGKPVAEIVALQEAGQISFNDVAAAIEKMTQKGGNRFGAMAMGLTTLSGKWDRMKEVAEFSMAAIGKALDKQLNLKGLVDTGADVLQGLPDAIKTFEPALADVKIAFGAVWDVVREGWAMMKPFFDEMSVLWRSMGFDALDTRNTIIGIFEVLFTIGGGLVDLFKLIGGSVLKYFSAPLMISLGEASLFLSGLFDKLSALPSGLGKMFGRLATSTEWLGKNALKGGVFARDLGEKALQGAWDMTSSKAVEKMFDRIRSGATDAKDPVKKLAAAATSIADAVTPAEMFTKALKGMGEGAALGSDKLEQFALNFGKAKAIFEQTAKPGGGKLEIPREFKLTPQDFSKRTPFLSQVVKEVEATKNRLGGLFDEPAKASLESAAEREMFNARLKPAIGRGVQGRLKPESNKLRDTLGKFGENKGSLDEAIKAIEEYREARAKLSKEPGLTDEDWTQTATMAGEALDNLVKKVEALQAARKTTVGKFDTTMTEKDFGLKAQADLEAARMKYIGEIQSLGSAAETSAMFNKRNDITKAFQKFKFDEPDASIGEMGGAISSLRKALYGLPDVSKTNIDKTIDALEEMLEKAKALQKVRVDFAVVAGFDKDKKEFFHWMDEKALKTIEETRNPLDVLAKQVDDLKVNFDRGALTADQYALGLLKVYEAAEKAANIGDLKLPQLAERGSAEAVAAINRFNLGGPTTGEERAQATFEAIRTIQQQQLNEAKGIRRAVEELARERLPFPMEVP